MHTTEDLARRHMAASYALSKQIATVTSIESEYGTIELDEQQLGFIKSALRACMNRQLERIEKAMAKAAAAQ